MLFFRRRGLWDAGALNGGALGGGGFGRRVLRAAGALGVRASSGERGGYGAALAMDFSNFGGCGGFGSGIERCCLRTGASMVASGVGGSRGSGRWGVARGDYGRQGVRGFGQLRVAWGNCGAIGSIIIRCGACQGAAHCCRSLPPPAPLAATPAPKPHSLPGFPSHQLYRPPPPPKPPSPTPKPLVLPPPPRQSPPPLAPKPHNPPEPLASGSAAPSSKPAAPASKPPTVDSAGSLLCPEALKPRNPTQPLAGGSAALLKTHAPTPKPPAVPSGPAPKPQSATSKTLRRSPPLCPCPAPNPLTPTSVAR
ncbi:hypothetical protein GUJ93_ZPchr0010g11105 [Zizania palustris]|uniref:Uncharacterized protein n=1 Tax=Zizania palustris TaxID=103762 RepID=A0A8J5VTB2_ZIZPA|nr:hypothetical protein GUJ93_ZPchr0010g11105 [Zizania palustris]